MKSIIILFLLIALLPMQLLAQYEHDFGISSSWRGYNHTEDALNISGECNLHHKKMRMSINIGFECWYVYSSLELQNSMKPSYSGKVEGWYGGQSNLFKSHFFLSANVGARVYFLNQIKDSISLYDRDYEKLSLSSSSRTYVQSLPLYNPGPYNHQKVKGLYSYVTDMPFALLTRVDFGYEFEKFKIRAFFMPYWVRFHYENAADPTVTGKMFYFFYDIGVGVNYTLPSKKKTE